jgi:hypothetical protein
VDAPAATAARPRTRDRRKKATSADAPRTDRQPQRTDEPWF